MIRAVLRRILVLAALVAPPLLVTAPPLLAAAFKASIDRPPADQGDTFELVLSLTGRDSLEPPNVTPLSRDFEILDRRKRSRVETVAGRPVDVNEWVLTLAPKRAGRLTVPPLSLGGETTQAIDMDVAPGAAIEPPDDGPVSLVVEVAASPPFFLQSEIPVVVRMYDRVGAMEANADQPTADGATFTPDGTLKTYSRVFGRQRYRIVELRYIMRPQRTGTLLIPAVALRATVPTMAPGAQEQARALGRPSMPWLGGVFGSGRKVTVFADPVEVEVRPRPAGVTGWFLPARAVSLTESWSRPPAQAKVGDTLVRTLRLEVRGATPGQLPPLAAPEVEGVRQYADEGRPEARPVDGGVGAVVETKVSVVPTRAGPVTLPAITVPWWNTATSSAEAATLPPVTLDVAPAADAGPAPVAAAPPVAAAAPAAAGADGDAGAGGWSLRDLLAAGAVAVLLAVAVVSGVRWKVVRDEAPPAPRPPARRPARPAARPAPVVAPARVMSPEEAVRAIAAACRKGDAAGAHRAWLAWSQSQGRGVAGHRARTPRMAEALEDLSHHLYGGGSAWDGRAFHKAFAAEQRAAARPAGRKAVRTLQPLYPSSR